MIFYAADKEKPINSSVQLAEMLRQEARRQQPQHRIAIGMGQKAAHVNQWRESYQDAQQAVDLACRLETDEPLYIGDLGMYHPSCAWKTARRCWSSPITCLARCWTTTSATGQR